MFLKRLLFIALCIGIGSSIQVYSQDEIEQTHPTALKDLVVAFYDQDILKVQFEYYAEKDNYLKEKQKLFQEELDKMISDYQNYVQRNEKKANNGLLSQDQIQKISEEVLRKEEELTRFDENIGQKLVEEVEKDLDKIGKKIDKYSALFCEDKGIDILLIQAAGGQISYINPSLNVTTEFIKYMNEMVPVKEKSNK